MSFRSIILKPDFFENIEYYHFLIRELKNNDLIINRTFIIENYTNLNQTYRIRDLKSRFKKKIEFDKNFQRTLISINSYSAKFPNNFGLLLTIKSKSKESSLSFYNKLDNIKSRVRNFVNRKRKYSYLYIEKKQTHQVITAKIEEFDLLSKKYGKNIKAAFVNAIHLEDYKNFKHNFCYKFFLKSKITNHEIDSNDIIKLFYKPLIDIDLHIHSIKSDGDTTIKDIFRYCNKSNIKTISITDHDMFTFAQSKKLKIVNGIEFSTLYRNKKVHLLCYNFKPTNKYFKKVLHIQENNRIKTLKHRVHQIKDKYNIEISNDIVERLIKERHFSRNFLIQELVKLKSSSSEKVKEIINSLDHGKSLIDIKVLIKNMKKAKSLIFLAHPLGNNKKTLSFDEFVNIYKPLLKKLDGIETFYSQYDTSIIEKIYRLCQQHSLLSSFGSDYHKNKIDTLGKISHNQLSLKLFLNYLESKYRLLKRFHG